jgi:hypothetical protein
MGIGAPNIFYSLYRIYDLMYHSKPLVLGCQLLGDAVYNTTMAGFESRNDISRILNNIANNYAGAMTSFADVHSYVSTP